MPSITVNKDIQYFMDARGLKSHEEAKIYMEMVMQKITADDVKKYYANAADIVLYLIDDARLTEEERKAIFIVYSLNKGILDMARKERAQ